ncbi:peptide ABC transporter permease [Arthrobacter alpinus]|uniref:ABC transporter permease n=1 Tax=Arthrobacter alpinus TaxID=656366 RepID=UPI0005CA6212|nr:ABC transporter permease [Arthrobacter alpinus]ALV44362.1 peptide ABC transporter permease [Arthrobacter alpinus]
MSMLEEIAVPDVAAASTEIVQSKKPVSRFRLVVSRLRSTPRFWVGFVGLALISLWAIFGLVPNAWNHTDLDVYNMGVSPSALHWFGTSDIGEDIYAQTVVGLRKSLIIGLLVGPLAAIIAGIVGAIAGYLGGWWDKAIVWFVDLLLVLPSLFLFILIGSAFKGLSWVALIFLLAGFGWMIMARVIRAQTKSLRERDFIKAARFMGVDTWTIIRRHVLPNVSSLLIIDATLGVGAAILSESTLSFFGFGIQAPDVSLGTLLSAGQGAAATRPWLFVFPAAALVFAVLSASLVGDALRDAVDPTSGVNRD